MRQTTGSFKVKDLIYLLEEDGWRLERTRGGHREFKHSDKPAIVIVAGKAGAEVPPATLHAALRQAGL